jgi:Holliday junction resolvasome RuvABC DNA-binding subunit
MDEFFESMHSLGYTEEQTRELLAAWNKKEESV